MNVIRALWTGFCLVVGLALILLLTADQNYSGDNITLKTNSQRNLSINAESVTVEVASGSFFVLRTLSGESIVGSPTQKPLGWDKDEYFKAGPTQVGGGKWIIEKGAEITVHLTGSKSIVVIEALNDANKFVIALLLAAIVSLIWLFGYWMSARS